MLLLRYHHPAESSQSKVKIFISICCCCVNKTLPDGTCLSFFFRFLLISTKCRGKAEEELVRLSIINNFCERTHLALHARHWGLLIYLLSKKKTSVSLPVSVCVCEEKARSPRHSSNRFLLLFLLSFFLAPSAPRAIVAAVDGGGSPGSGTVWRHCQPNPSLFFSFFFFPLYILADSLEPPFTHTHSPFFFYFLKQKSWGLS